MKVTHLYHSGCLVELDDHILLFDYYQGELNLDPNKPLYVFASHSHQDHFTESVFDIRHPYITYIFSSSVPKTFPALYLDANQTYKMHDMTIKTLLSTDEGCAFIVEVEGKTIYHAGDLNWWHWEGEPEESNEYQKETYQQQINLIHQPVDVAFVVVDKRQEKDYTLGLSYFLKNVECRYVFPIHYFGEYSISDELEKEELDNPYQAQIISVKHPQQEWEISF